MGEIGVRTNNFTCLPVTHNTLEKIKTYAKISGGKECYGFLLSPLRLENGIVYDAILAPGQNVSGGHANINGISAVNAKAEIENRGCKAMGFWHSHGSYPVFHSGTDNENMDRLLLSFTGNTEEKDYVNDSDYMYGFTKDGRLLVKSNSLEFKLELDKKSESFSVETVNDIYSELVLAITKDNNIFINDGVKRFTAKGPKRIDMGNCTSKSYKTAGVAYSIVTNLRGDIYAEVGYSRWCNTCERLERGVNKKANLNIIGVREDIQFDEKQLVKEFEEKVEGFQRKNEKSRFSIW